MIISKVIKLKFWLAGLILLICNMSVAMTKEQRLTAQRLDYIDGMNSRSTELITRYYSSNIRLMPEANPTIFGVENATMLFDEFFSRYSKIRYKREKTHLLEMGEYTAEIGSYIFNAKNREGIERSVTGKYLNLWKQAGEQYSLIADIWNFDHGIDFKHEWQFKEVPSIITAMQPHTPISTPLALDLAAYAALGDANIPMRDGNVIAQVYADDAIILTNYRPPILGGKAIRTYWREHAKELPGFETLQNRSDKILQAGEHAIQFASHLAAWRSGENSGVSSGKHIRIWKRQAHGGLRTQVIISAYDG